MLFKIGSKNTINGCKDNVVGVVKNIILTMPDTRIIYLSDYSAIVKMTREQMLAAKKFANTLWNGEYYDMFTFEEWIDD